MAIKLYYYTSTVTIITWRYVTDWSFIQPFIRAASSTQKLPKIASGASGGYYCMHYTCIETNFAELSFTTK